MATTALQPVSTSNLPLFERIKAGDEEAFNELYSSNYERVSSAIKRFIHEPDIIEHIANGVFMRVWQVRNTPAGYKGGSSLATWLTRIAYNEALMYLRKNKPERFNMPLDVLVDTGEDVIKPEIATRDTNLEGIFDRTELAYAIDRLPTSFRTVFQLRLIDGLSTEETCKALNLAIPAVKSRLYRGRLMVQEILERRKNSRRMLVKKARATV